MLLHLTFERSISLNRSKESVKAVDFRVYCLERARFILFLTLQRPDSRTNDPTVSLRGRGQNPDSAVCKAAICWSKVDITRCVFNSSKTTREKQHKGCLFIFSVETIYTLISVLMHHHQYKVNSKTSIWKQRCNKVIIMMIRVMLVKCSQSVPQPAKTVNEAEPV